MCSVMCRIMAKFRSMMEANYDLRKKSSIVVLACLPCQWAVSALSHQAVGDHSWTISVLGCLYLLLQGKHGCMVCT